MVIITSTKQHLKNSHGCDERAIPRKTTPKAIGYSLSSGMSNQKSRRQTQPQQEQRPPPQQSSSFTTHPQKTKNKNKTKQKDENKMVVFCCAAPSTRGILKNETDTITPFPNLPLPRIAHKNVLFSSTPDDVCTIPAVADYSPEEMRKTWFVSCDYARIKKSNKVLVRLMNNGAVGEEDSVCFRGLEYKAKAGHKLRKSIRSAAASAVLREQFRQQCHGVWDSEVIRRAYESISLDAQERAQVLAAKDAEIVNVVVADTSADDDKKENIIVVATRDDNDTKGKEDTSERTSNSEESTVPKAPLTPAAKPPLSPSTTNSIAGTIMRTVNSVTPPRRSLVRQRPSSPYQTHAATNWRGR